MPERREARGGGGPAVATALAALVATLVAAGPGLVAAPRAADLDAAREAARVGLGALLFWDPRSSPSGTTACATCHRPDHGWSDPRPLPLDDAGRPMRRHAPTIVNRADAYWQTWSGRHGSLEAQVRHEANRRDDLVLRLVRRPAYRERFLAAFGGEPTIDRAAEAIAGYVRTIVSRDAPYDRFVGGELDALDPAARRGLTLFSGRALCVICHPPPAFTDEGFHNLGVGMDRPDPDPGRAEIYGNPADTGAFKTPTLRDVARRGPYMHDGSLATLDDVVAFYVRGGLPNLWRSTQVRPLALTADEQADLVAFLRALSGTVDPAVARRRVPLPY